MSFRLGVMVLWVLLAACSTVAQPQPPAAHWVRVELFFGVAARDASAEVRAQREQRWQAFLDEEVTPRFPDGLSVFDVSGQWRSPTRGVISHEHSKALMIVYPDSAQHRTDIEAIRSAWKLRSGDESVLRIMEPVDVAF